MKTYDIYAVGAALVDTEVEVEEKFLLDNSIEKGVMTLVDQPRLAKLFKGFSKSNSTLIKSSGGSACNSAVAASQYGSNVFFGGKIGADEDGKVFANDLTQAGVAHDFFPDPHGVTGKCLVMITKDAERTMSTFLGVSNNFSRLEVKDDVLACSEWFYIEGYLMTDINRTSVIASAVKYAKGCGAKIALSLSDPFVASEFSDNIKSIIGDGVDLIFCNQDEAIAFTKASSIQQALKLLKNYCKTFVVTRGSKGAKIFDGKLTYDFPGLKVNAVDTNGAGDMFAGIFLSAVSSGKSYQDSAVVANYAASKIVEQYGPRLNKVDFDALGLA